MNTNLHALAASLLAVSAAHAQDFFLTSTEAINTTTFTQRIHRYTLGSGVATTLHSFNLAQATISGIESTPAGLYMQTVNPNAASQNQLWSVDPLTGVPTSIGPTGIRAIEGDLAWNPQSLVLHAVGGIDSGGTEGTYTLNLLTGAAENVVNLAPQPLDVSGLTFDLQGRCWAIDSNLNGPSPAVLHELNPLTGAVLSSQPLAINLRVTLGLTTDPQTGTHYLISGQGRIYTLDTATAGLTLVDQLPFPTTTLAYTGITLVAIPAPGAALLLGLLGAYGIRRRRAM